jgi:hypothetical protein
MVDSIESDTQPDVYTCTLAAKYSPMEKQATDERDGEEDLPGDR